MLSDIKQRATHARDYSAHKFASVKDHMKSQRDRKSPPPSSASVRLKSAFILSSFRAHSAIVRSQAGTPENSMSSPSLPASGAPPAAFKQAARQEGGKESDTETDRIDRANLSQEDKKLSPQSSHRAVQTTAKEKPSPPPVPANRTPPSISPTPALRAGSPIPAVAPAPIAVPAAPTVPSAVSSPMSMGSRPAQQTPASSSVDDEPFDMSYPPPATHGSSALDLAHYFAPSTTWDSAWYAEPGALQPPPLRGNTEMRSAGAMMRRGQKKTVCACVLFADLSMCWWSVSFQTGHATDPNDASSVHRAAEYLPRPRALDRAALLKAHETYGEIIAAYAESHEDTGQYCARGECWDLAHQALEHVARLDGVPKPVPSTSRTHGHLIFCGMATGKGFPQYGWWRGGDDRVRRGDIVEWRSVVINTSVGKNTHTQRLGDPDHTAIVVSDAVPSVAVADGQSVLPADLGALEVVEQSVVTGSTPHRSTYLLGGMEEGEIWIYRPVSMEAYIGCLLDTKKPDGVNALTL
ncbi:hypothetical protein WOLCODRAFT_138149 [Wolfiporia cocos MD-104 SS10]|uniref:BBC1/AIM3 cysteine proteinase-fold domain-containing protein n=1 Tax=Wolfiporia cocos (strain MD-104) TaxID=742152 RepID=A0A2H3JLB7_WOLCO|nr:hypothetical protein WOLCODRAFT_138149 [Wolfiporia cocos MD-104 SS10]